MQAIRTRYICQTNNRGSRIQAKCEAKTLYVSYDDALNIEENHAMACRALLRAMSWDTPFYTPTVAGVFEGDHYHVFTPKA